MATIRGPFAQSVFQNTFKVLKQVNDQCYKIGIELFLAIVAQTPSPTHPGVHAKGLLVNNWFPMEGEAFSIETTSATSPNGAASIARINALQGRQFYLKDGVLTLTNNIPYAYLAEVEGWKPPKWSGKVGPYAMVAKSLLQISAKYK